MRRGHRFRFTAGGRGGSEGARVVVEGGGEITISALAPDGIPEVHGANVCIEASEPHTSN